MVNLHANSTLRYYPSGLFFGALLALGRLNRRQAGARKMRVSCDQKSGFAGNHEFFVCGDNQAQET